MVCDIFKEEKAREKQAKEEEAAALEFEKWKGEFSVDAEGTTENDAQDEGQGLLFDFVEYIKVVPCSCLHGCSLCACTSIIFLNLSYLKGIKWMFLTGVML